MPRRRLDGQRLVAVFLLGCLMFNFPLLAIFDRLGWVAGVPAVYMWLMFSWLVLIALMAWAARGSVNREHRRES